MKEIQLINEIKKRAGKPPEGVVAGIGDDCAVLKFDKKSYLLWATDMLTEGTHFKLKDGYEKIGRKAVAVNISDIAAMGGEPKYITVTLGVPRTMSMAAIRRIYMGIEKICSEYGISILGGDTNRSVKLVIDVSIIGSVSKEELLMRSGAKPGDLILVTGPVRNGKKEHLDFIPRLAEARFLAKNFKVSSMIDVSDGIALDVGRVSAESRTGCTLYADAVPLSRGLSLGDALYYGESFELLFTMTPPEARKLFLKMKSHRKKMHFYVIGEVTQKKKGLSLVGKEGKISALKKEGFRHL